MNKSKFNRIFHKKDKGQILIILGFMLVGLIAVIGLALDLGQMYVQYARLRRAVDAAALSASSHFREGYTTQSLTDSAQQFLNLNEIIDTTDISIETCETNPGDTILCTTPPRKIVRVSVSQTVPLYFLSIIGITEVPITVMSVSETASVDIFLVVDTSESMTFGDDDHIVADGDPMRDPSQCNAADALGADGYPGECQPFESVKAASLLLLDSLFEDYDRVGIVTFDRYANMVLPLTDQFDDVRSALRSLSVIPLGVGICPYPTAYLQPGAIPAGIEGVCRLYDDPSTLSGYRGLWCDASLETIPDPSRCTTTNIGGAMEMAGNALGGVYPLGGPSSGVRDDALWAVILLTDGAANAGYDEFDNPYCPALTWTAPPYCRDLDARPSLSDLFNARHTIGQTLLYDADDYARDQVDFVWKDQNALIFSIGLGDQVTSISPGEVTSTPPGETLLQYASVNGHGIYRYAPNGADLVDIFNEIGAKIATRLNR